MAVAERARSGRVQPRPLSGIPDFDEHDEIREESMADEGGASGAVMEAEEFNPEPLIAVPRAEHNPDEPGGITEAPPEIQSEELPSTDIWGEELTMKAKNAALLMGLGIAVGFYVYSLWEERQRGRKPRNLHLVRPK